MLCRGCKGKGLENLPCLSPTLVVKLGFGRQKVRVKFRDDR